MATHMESIEARILPVTPYEELRDKLECGDLLFASGDYLVSKLMQKVTDSLWSHVGIIFRLENIDRVMLLESVEDYGVRFAPLSKYLTDYENEKPYKGRVVLSRCAGVDEQIVSGLAGYGIDQLSRPYGKEEVAQIMCRIALGIKKKERERDYICSELVYETFSHAGKEFGHNGAGFLSPEDIWLDEHVFILGRIL